MNRPPHKPRGPHLVVENAASLFDFAVAHRPYPRCKWTFKKVILPILIKEKCVPKKQISGFIH